MALTLVYDGGCPFCRHFAQRSELVGGLPDLVIRDGRSDHALRTELRDKGFNLSNGAVLMDEEHIWHGSEAISMLWRRFSSKLSRIDKRRSSNSCSSSSSRCSSSSASCFSCASSPSAIFFLSGERDGKE